MRLIYQCLGGLASLDSRLSRIRCNAVPSNWLLLGFLAYGVYVLVSGAVDAATNSPTPAAISLSQINSATAGTQHYVRISGEILPAVIYRFESNSTTEWWSPLIDRDSEAAILVKRSGNIDMSPAHQLSVTGMLRALDASARQRLADNGDRAAGVRVDPRYELDADEHPAEPRAAVALAGLASILFVAWITVMLRRDEIFQAGGSFAVPQAIVSGQPVPVRVTGRFYFDAKTARRFPNVPAVLVMENGRVLLKAKIDVSGRFLGVSMRNQVGIWAIAFAPGSLTEGRFGFAYYGWSRRYAYRFTYTQESDGKRRRAMIAADAPQDLMAVAALATGSMPASFASAR